MHTELNQLFSVPCVIVDIGALYSIKSIHGCTGGVFRPRGGARVTRPKWAGKVREMVLLIG